MSVTTEPTNASPDDAPRDDAGASPPSRRRVLLYAAAPVVLLILLMTGVRFVSDATQRREAEASAQAEQELRSLHPNSPESRPSPIPMISYKADKATQAELEGVVRGQLRAIADQDFSKALTFAIPGMPHPEQFGNMIRSGYPAMLTAKKITISPARIQGRKGYIQQALLETEVLTETGTVARFGYMLVGDEKGWRVAGVTPDRGNLLPREEDGLPPRQYPSPKADLLEL